MGLFSKSINKEPLPTGTPTATVSVAVLLSDLVLLDINDFRRFFKAVGGSRASCKEIPLARKEYGEFQRLELESEGRVLTMSLRSGPLPKEMLSMMGRMTDVSVMGPDATEAQVESFNNHKAHAVIGCIVFEDKENPQRPVNLAWLLVETLMTLFECRKEFIGYAPLSAQVYRPREWIESRLKVKKIDQSELFMLLCNVRLFKGEDNWMHTRGMEQFGQPDLEIWFKDPDKGRYCFELLINTAMYSLTESVFALGQTFEITGDPVKYKFVAPRNVANHTWGKFGALQMEPVAGT